jgi:hypothetical protein
MDMIIVWIIHGYPNSYDPICISSAMALVTISDALAATQIHQDQLATQGCSANSRHLIPTEYLNGLVLLGKFEPETMVFTIKYGVFRFQFSPKPIHSVSGWWGKGMMCKLRELGA